MWSIVDSEKYNLLTKKDKLITYVCKCSAGGQILSIWLGPRFLYSTLSSWSLISHHLKNRLQIERSSQP